MSASPINALALIDVTVIDTDGRNVRDDLGDLTELAASIRAVGVLQPLTVAKAAADRFTLIHGHRRLGAALLAGRLEVPCVVRAPRGEVETRIERLAENLHRRSLTALEEATQYRILLRDGLTQRDLARRVGVAEAHVSTRLVLLELPDDAQALLRAGHMTLKEGIHLARQVRKNGHGQVRHGSPPAAAPPLPTPAPSWTAHSYHFAWRHRLAHDVAGSCTHPDRPQVGAVGCGPCWEDRIRADERARINGDPPPRISARR